MTRGLALYSAFEAALGRSLTWRIGRWLYLGSRRELANDPSENGEYALQKWVLTALKQQGRSASVRFMDVGANLGEWSEKLVESLSCAGIEDFLIHGFEPAPAQRAALLKRFGRNIAAGRYVVDGRALSAKSGRAQFMVTGERTGTSSLDVVAHSRIHGSIVEIEVSTLDEVVHECAYQRVDFAKVDTEGNDFNAILGGRSLFDDETIGLMQFEYNWRWIGFGHWLRDVFAFIQDRPYALGRLTNENIEIYKAWNPELERYIQTNYVLVHKDILSLLPHRVVVFDGSNVVRNTSFDGQRV